MKEQIKKFFRGLMGRQAEPTPPVPRPASMPTRRPQISAQVGPPSPSRTGARVDGQSYAAKSLDLQLQSIIVGLPSELQSELVTSDVGLRLVQVPLEKVLPQLSRGSVRITFGELRRLAPDVFGSGNDRDASWITLPLSEILGQLNPGIMTRRRGQRQVQIPDEISSPFDAANRPRVEGTPPAKRAGETEPALPPKPPVPAPEQSLAPRSAAQPNLTASRPQPTPFPSPPDVSMPRPKPFGIGQKDPTPLPPGTPTSGNNGGVAHSNGNGKDRNGNGRPAGNLTTAPRFTLPTAPTSGGPTPAQESQGAQRPMPAPIGNIGAPVKARFDGTEPPITATLGHLSAGWPEPVRQEILDFHLEGAQVNIPVGFLEQALKQGRVVTNWKTVRQWLRPAAPVKISPVDATPLELPLQVVTPPFLARQRVRLHERQKVEVDKDIPNLFFGFPQPETPQAPKDRPPGSGDTNYFVWDDATDEVKAQSPGATSGRTSPGTRFVSKYATPNEVVSRAAVLEGVAGALIALPDGLMVASRLSPDLNGETLAAFLPQIFGKVSQSTKELRMGELNNLNFTVGNVPWKIFRVNAIYFAAFGREGQALPTATLAGLAAELDHNK